MNSAITKLLKCLRRVNYSLSMNYSHFMAGSTLELIRANFLVTLLKKVNMIRRNFANNLQDL